MVECVHPTCTTLCSQLEVNISSSPFIFSPTLAFIIHSHSLCVVQKNGLKREMSDQPFGTSLYSFSTFFLLGFAARNNKRVTMRMFVPQASGFIY